MIQPAPVRTLSFAETATVMNIVVNDDDLAPAMQAAPPQAPRVNDSVRAALMRADPLVATLRVVGGAIAGATVGNGLDVLTSANFNPPVLTLIGAAAGFASTGWWILCPGSMAQQAAPDQP